LKSNVSGLQWLLIITAVCTIVLILLLPRVPIVNTEGAHDHSSHEHDEEGVTSDFIEGLTSERQLKIQHLEKELALAAPSDKVGWVDSLILYWRLFEQPEAEAEYLKKRAELLPSEESWFVAGDNYFSNFRSTPAVRKNYMIRSAIDCYHEVLALNAENLSAKNAIGVCYVEGAAILKEPPMKGIGMIREVLEKDPENIDALVNLGYFAIQSGQYERAIERFNTVLEIDSNHSEAYLYLTDIYLSLEKKEIAISNLKKYKKFVDDPVKIDQIDNYIEEIKRNK
jgi:tetratricopeptide (TPR) repeat protein